MIDYYTLNSVLRNKKRLENNQIERFIGKLESYEVDDKSINKFIELIKKESQTYLKNVQAENPTLTHNDVRVRMSTESDHDGNDYAFLTFYITDKFNQKEKRFIKKYIDDNKHHFKELLDD